LVFIHTASARFITLWKAQLSDSDSWILDIGCGTGINNFVLPNQHVFAAFDISKEVIQRDTEEAGARGMMANTTFFVADGEFLCFKDDSFQFAQTFGALHHLPNPAQAIKDNLRILKPGGVYFGVENNKTRCAGFSTL
jgi:ubiquinone/menaquinone biosynthesis C-methylase UbiE